MTALRKGMPELPERMRYLPVSDKGYPIPYFVGKLNGVYDFRIVDPEKFMRAVKRRLCWLCGQPLGQRMTFVIGPMCAVNRTSSEPPSHYECSHFAVRACPFLLLPNAQRRDAGLPENLEVAGGYMIPHNPGATLIWVTRDYEVKPDGRGGTLVHLGIAERIEYYREGRRATRGEVVTALEKGAVKLRDMAGVGKDRDQLERMLREAYKLLPQE